MMSNGSSLVCPATALRACGAENGALINRHLVPLQCVKVFQSRQMTVAASGAAGAGGDTKHRLVKRVWKRDLSAGPVVKNRSHHASEMTFSTPKLHVEKAVPAMEQDRVLKPGARFAFEFNQGVAGQQEFIRCSRPKHLNSDQVLRQHSSVEALSRNPIQRI